MEVKTSFPTKSFVRANAKSHDAMHAALILDNSYGNRFCSDISDVDYGKNKLGYRKSSEIPNLREIFCDNVMFFMLVPSHTINNGATTDCGSGSLEINKHFKEFCASNNLEFHEGARAKRTIDLSAKTKAKMAVDGVGEDDIICAKGVRSILANNPNILRRYRVLHNMPEDKDYGYVSYKLSFSEYTAEHAIKFCLEYKDKLAKHIINLHEIDFTMDFGCSFNKAEMWEYLQDQKMRGEPIHLVENDKVVGKNCLSFLHIQDKWITRCKFYNKFAQSLELRNLSTKIGMHLDNWILNRETQLRDTMYKSLDYGFTRLEITFYSADLEDLSEYMDELQYLQDLVLKSGKMFQCPIEAQWRAFAEKLSCNMAIIDLDTKQYALGMWCNTLTRRIGGVSGKFEDTQFKAIDSVIAWIASHFSYRSGIINIATLKATGDNTEMCVRSFVKTGNNIHTYIPGGSRGCLWYCPDAQIDRYDENKLNDKVTPMERGIVDCPNVNFRMFQKKFRVDSKPVGDFMQVNPVCKNISINTVRQRTKIIADADSLACMVKEMADLTIENKRTIEQANKLIEANKIRQESLCIFADQCSYKYARKLSASPQNVLMEFLAFKEIHAKFGKSYIMLDTNRDVWFSNAYLAKCLENSLAKLSYDPKSEIYHSPDLGVAYSCKRHHNYPTRDNKDAASVDNFRGVCFKLDDTINGIDKYVDIPSHLKHRDLDRLESLEINATYTLEGIKQYFFKKTKYMLVIDGKYYASNYWLEENLQVVNEDGRTNYLVLKDAGVKTKFKTYIKRTNPTNKSELRCTAL